MKTVLDLTKEEAKEYFLKSNNYFNAELPAYLDFSKMLKLIDDELRSGGLGTSSAKAHKTSYSINMNKDGSYDWRMLELINPILYVCLVKFLTLSNTKNTNNWKRIKDKFIEYKNNSPNIKVKSIPIIVEENENQKKEQILNWWQEVEQESILLNLKYKYMADIDISNCYGSIYTHSLVWAIEGEAVGKDSTLRRGTFGQLLDDKLQEINFGETHGIPQGSVLMDFIAEILLGYIDTRISSALLDKGILDYYIIRYRDDYRIFSNNKDTIDNIIKLISIELSRFKMKLNSKKTKVSEDIIGSSVKEAKLYWNSFGKSEKNLDKHLLNIYDFSKKYPNAGYLKRILSNTFKLIPDSDFMKVSNDVILSSDLGSILESSNEQNSKSYEDSYSINRDRVNVSISILLQLLYNNPMVYHLCLAIYSKLLYFIEDNAEKTEIIDLIIKRMNDKPYNEYFEIWMQRIIFSYSESIEFNFESELSKAIYEFKTDTTLSFHKLWNFSWVDNTKSVFSKINDFNIIVEEKLITIPKIFSDDEVSVFLDKSL